MSSDPAESLPTRVLLVEDDPDIRSALCDLLEYRGYEVRSACHGREALDQLAGGPLPDVILLDLMMPVMNGPDFRAAQLADRALARIPVVVLTASDLGQDSVRALDVDAAFTKPFDLRVLFATIDRLARQGRRREAPRRPRTAPATLLTTSAPGS